MAVLSDSQTPIVISDNERTLNSSESILKRLCPKQFYPCALKLLCLNHLGRRAFTSAMITLQRWFKPASLSFKKLPSVGDSFWTIMSPVLFSAAKLGWWLLIPSSSSYNRVQFKINSTAKLNCSDEMDPHRYHGVNLRIRQTKSWKDILCS